MRIVIGNPPNFAEIVAKFPRAAKHGVIFTYGGSMFVSEGYTPPSWIMAHEETHSLRQGANPAAWWDQYLADAKFRLDEEAIAHRMEWHSGLNIGQRNRHDRRAMMKAIAGRLSGPLYGRMVSFDRAESLILPNLIGETHAAVA